MKHGSESVVGNVVQVDEGRAEELRSKVLHAVEVLLHGRTCLPEDVETVRENHGQWQIPHRSLPAPNAPGISSPR